MPRRPRTQILLLQPGRTVDTFGVRFRPGAARQVLHLPRHELLDRAAPLEEFLGLAGAESTNQILDATDPTDRVSRATTWLRERMTRRPGPHPALRHAVGSTPKRFGRTVRLNALLARMRSESTAPWADLALEFGFVDQSHLVREFRSLATASVRLLHRRLKRRISSIPVDALPLTICLVVTQRRIEAIVPLEEVLA